MVFENLGQHLGGYSQGMLQAAIAGREQALKEKNMQLQAPLQIAQTLTQGLGQWAQLDQAQQQIKLQEARDKTSAKASTASAALDMAQVGQIEENVRDQVLGRDMRQKLLAYEVDAKGLDNDVMVFEFQKGQALYQEWLTAAPERKETIGQTLRALVLSGDKMELDMGFDKRTEDLRVLALENQNDYVVAQIGMVNAEIAETGVRTALQSNQLDFFEFTLEARVNAEYLKNDTALKQLDALDASIAHQKVLTEKEWWEVDYLRQTLGARVLAEKEGLKQLKAETLLLEDEHGRSGLVTEEMQQRIKLLGQQVELSKHMTKEKFRELQDARTYYKGGTDFFNPDMAIRANAALQSGKLLDDLEAISAFAAKHPGPITPNDMFDWMAKNLSPEFIGFMTTTAGKRTTSSKMPGQYWEDITRLGMNDAKEQVSLDRSIIDNMSGAVKGEQQALRAKLQDIIHKAKNIQAMKAFIGSYTVEELRVIHGVLNMEPSIHLPAPNAQTIIDNADPNTPSVQTAGGDKGLEGVWLWAVESAGLDAAKSGVPNLGVGASSAQQAFSGLFQNQLKGPPFNP